MYQENTGAQAQPESFQAFSITAVAADPCPGHFQRRALDLFDAGYRVTLLPAGCKGPVDRGWQVTTERQTRDGVEAMVRHAPPGAGVGILARWTPAVDLDVRDVELVRKLAELARRKLGWTVERVGQAPKVLLPYRTAVPFAKKRLEFRLPDGSSHAIEVLCDGQQWVCFHKHPNTGRPYVWLDGELPPRDELSEITEGGAVEFLAAARELITAHGGTVTSESRPAQANGQNGEHAAKADQVGTVEAIRSALAAIPNEGNAVPWDEWSRIAMGIKAAIGEEGWPLFLAWSQRSAKFNQRETEKRWRGINREAVHTCGAQTVYGLARDHGWVPPAGVYLNPDKRADVEHGAEIARRIIEAHQRRKEQAREEGQEGRGERFAGAPDFDEWDDEEPGGAPGEDAGESAGKNAAGAEANAGPGTAGDGWLEPIDLFADHFPGGAKLDESCLPRSLLVYAKAEADRLGVDPVGIAAFCIGACSGAIQDEWKIRIKEKDEWKQEARVWVALVSAPGTKKTEQMRSARWPLDEIDRELYRQFKKEEEQYEIDIEEWQKTDPKERDEKPQKPQLEKIQVQDTTIEAVQELLSGRPKKLLMSVDELSLLFNGIDRYSAGKMNSNRAAWLQLYEGGTFTVDRIGRGYIYIENWSMSIMGGIQPVKLREMMKNLASDGLLQRFMIIFPDTSQIGNIEDDDRATSPLIKAGYDALIRTLWDLKPTERAGGGCLTVRAGPGVQEERRRLLRLIERINRDPTIPEPLKETVNKWQGLLARLSLIFHLVRFVTKEVEVRETLDASTVRMAAEWIMRVVAPSTFKLYRELGADGNPHARWIAGYILAHPELERLSPREIGRAYRELRGDQEGIVETMTILEHAGWVRADTRLKHPKWDINPRVRIIFSDRAKQEKEHREHIQELLRRPLLSFVG